MAKKSQAQTTQKSLPQQLEPVKQEVVKVETNKEQNNNTNKKRKGNNNNNNNTVSKSTVDIKKEHEVNAPIIAPETQLPYHGLYILSVNDVTPTTVYTSQKSNSNMTNDDSNDNIGLTRYLYWTPKVATFDVPQITEEQAELLDQDDLYERFRVEKTVLIYGVPVHYNETTLKYIFSYFGEVEEVFFHPSIDYLSRVAELTMQDDEGYENIIDKFAQTHITVNLNTISTSPSSMTTATTSDEQPQINMEFGVNKYFQQFSTLCPDYSKLQNQVDLFMMAFDERTDAQRRAAKRPLVDSEGFILVTGDDRSVETAQKKFKQLTKDKRKRVDLKLKEARESELNFYKFHEESKQRKEDLKIRSDINRDKHLINKLKQTRSFNPF